MNLNVDIVQGNSPLLNFTAYQSDGETPYNLSDVINIVWTLAQSLQKPAPLLTKILGNGVNIISAAAGTFSVQLYASETLILDGSYLHEAVFIESDGNVVTLTNAKNQPGVFNVRKRLAKAS